MLRCWNLKWPYLDQFLTIWPKIFCVRITETRDNWQLLQTHLTPMGYPRHALLTDSDLELMSISSAVKYNTICMMGRLVGGKRWKGQVMIWLIVDISEQHSKISSSGNLGHALILTTFSALHWYMPLRLEFLRKSAQLVFTGYQGLWVRRGMLKIDSKKKYKKCKKN